MFSSISISSNNIFSKFLADFILASFRCFSPPRQQVSNSPGKLLYFETTFNKAVNFQLRKTPKFPLTL